MGNPLSCNSIPVRVLLTALLLCACAPSYAGWFGSDKQPVPQWGLDAAKTPTPAYVKDAAAVVLFDEYLESVDAQGRATETRRKAFRVLKLQGRRDAYCGVSYDVDDKINHFREWTIAADQKQYQAQDTDFIDIGDPNAPIMLSTTKLRAVNPPAADVGATILCDSEELLEPYIQEKDWEIQKDIPIVFQALEVDLPAGRSYSEAWHRFTPVKPVEVAPNHWRWELKDMPALDLRELRSGPEWKALAARMSVQWGDAAVEGKDNQWRAIGQWVTKLEANRPDPSPEIIAQTQSLIADAPDFYTKLSRITEYIQKNIRYFIVMRGIGGMQAHPAADIFRNRYGDCKDKTTLLISMLQVAGIHAFYVPVDDRRDVVDPDAPSLVGNHMITAIEIPADVQDARLKAIVKARDGKRYLIFDPTNERTPVGNLPYYEQGSYGTLAAGAASQIIALPVLDPEASTQERKGAFTLSADGTLTGSVDTTQFGGTQFRGIGIDFRYLIKDTDEKERREYLEKKIAETLPGVSLDSFEFVEPSGLEKPIELHYKVTARQYSHQAGPLVLVRPRVVGTFTHPFDDKPRIYPIDLNATGRWRDSFDIAIPPGYAVDETPDPVSIDLDFASYHSSVTAKGNLLHYEREYVVRQVEIPPAKAADFRHLESVILSDEKNAAVLKKQ
jgi:transglutaminase-like putative cysteine protease